MFATVSETLIKNSHLEGGPFFWKAESYGVLLIHGFTATTAEIRPLAKSLHAKGYTVTGPVLPGHNAYPEDINKYTWQDWIASVEMVYDELSNQCEQVFVGGESTGGLISLYLATQHPEISGVLTYAPALKINLSLFDQILLRLMAPFVEYLPKTGKDDDLPWKGYTVNPLKGTLQLLDLQKQVRPRLQLIHQPLLIIQGRLDNTVNASVPQMIFNGVNSITKEIHWMEKSGHCVALDYEFEKVLEVTLKFLSELKN